MINNIIIYQNSTGVNVIIFIMHFFHIGLQISSLYKNYTLLDVLFVKQNKYNIYLPTT